MTVLVLDIRDASAPGTVLADHLWFNYTKEFAGLALHSGDVIEFNARVGAYEKGYREDDEDNPKRIDYHLAYPRKIVVVGHEGSERPSQDAANAEKRAAVEKHEQDRIARLVAWKEQQGRSNVVPARPPAPAAVAEPATAPPAAADSGPEFHSILEYLRRKAN